MSSSKVSRLRRRKRREEAEAATVHRAGLTVAIGGGLGALTALGLAPVISRIYDPETFGEFALLVAVVSTFVGFTTLRFEILGQTEKTERAFAASIKLAIASALFISLVATAVALVAYFLGEISIYWTLVGALMFVGSIQSVGSAIYSRRQEFKTVAMCSFAQQSSMPAVQALIGLVSPSVGALVGGFAIARLPWTTSFWSVFRVRTTPMRDVYFCHRRSASQAGLSALVNSAGGQVLLLGLSVGYGAAIVGIVGMAVRLVVGPLSIVSQSVGIALIGKIGLLVREHRSSELLATLRRAALGQAALAAVPCLGVIALAPWLLPMILGPGWDGAGIAASILAIGAYAQFIGSPFAQVLNLTGDSKTLLGWDILRLVGLSIGIMTPLIIGGDWISAMIGYCIAQVAIYIALGITVARALRAEG